MKVGKKRGHRRAGEAAETGMKSKRREPAIISGRSQLTSRSLSISSPPPPALRIERA